MLKVKQKTYASGNRFRDLKYNDEYILATVDYSRDNDGVLVTLINLKTGNRRTGPIVVENAFRISHEIIKKLTGSGIFEEIE